MNNINLNNILMIRGINRLSDLLSVIVERNKCGDAR
jgi:hypothetical protein